MLNAAGMIGSSAKQQQAGGTPAMMDFEDFGHFGDERLFGIDETLFADDFNVYEENQVFLDDEGNDDDDEIVDEDDVAGFEDDGYEMGLGLE